jgi:hypothetical protein
MPNTYSGPAYTQHQCSFPDVVRARAPRGLREKINEAAKSEHITAGELVRRAVETYLAAHRSHRHGRRR